MKEKVKFRKKTQQINKRFAICTILIAASNIPFKCERLITSSYNQLFVVDWLFRKHIFSSTTPYKYLYVLLFLFNNNNKTELGCFKVTGQLLCKLYGLVFLEIVITLAELVFTLKRWKNASQTSIFFVLIEVTDDFFMYVYSLFRLKFFFFNFIWKSECDEF